MLNSWITYGLVVIIYDFINLIEKLLQQVNTSQMNLKTRSWPYTDFYPEHVESGRAKAHIITLRVVGGQGIQNCAHIAKGKLQQTLCPSKKINAGFYYKAWWNLAFCLLNLFSLLVCTTHNNDSATQMTSSFLSFQNYSDKCIHSGNSYDTVKSACHSLAWDDCLGQGQIYHATTGATHSNTKATNSITFSNLFKAFQNVFKINLKIVLNYLWEKSNHKYDLIGVLTRVKKGDSRKICISYCKQQGEFP